MLYRILENLISNAVRVAKREITLSFDLLGRDLSITVSDDGCGVSEVVLKSINSYFASRDMEDPHSGIGLTICRILCKKHGGALIELILSV